MASARIDVRISGSLMERVLGMRLEQAESVGLPPTCAASSRCAIIARTVTAMIDLPFALLFVIVIAWISPWLVLPWWWPPCWSC